MRLMFNLLLPTVLCFLAFVGCDRKAKPAKEVVVLDPGTKMTVEVEAGSSISSIPLGPAYRPEAGSAMSDHSAPDFPPPRSVPIFRSRPEAGSTTSSHPARKFVPSAAIISQRKSPLTKTDYPIWNSNVEINAILANRQRYQVMPDITVEPPPQQIPSELRDLQDNSTSCELVTVCNLRFPVIKIHAKTDRTEATLQKILDADCSEEYGIQFSHLSVLGQELDLLRDPTIPAVRNVRHIICSLGSLSEESCRTLSEMKQLKSLTLDHCKLTDAQFKKIIQNESIEAVSLIGEAESLSLAAIANVCDMPNLKGFHLKEDPDFIGRESIDILFRELSVCPQLEYVFIQRETASQEAVHQFLGGCDRSQLRYLNIWNEPLTLWHSKRFDQCPNLEELSVSIASSRNDYVDYFLHSLYGGGGKKLRSLTIQLPEQQIRGLSAGSVLSILPLFPNLEEVNIPLRIEQPSHYESLTRMGKLRSFSFQNVIVDREMLYILARMPKLEHLTAKSLNFGEESAHLMPWVNLKSIYIENEETLNDSHVHLLSLCPQLSAITCWADKLKIDYNVFRNYPHLKFTDYD